MIWTLFLVFNVWLCLLLFFFQIKMMMFDLHWLTKVMSGEVVLLLCDVRITGCSFKLSRRNLPFGPLKCSKSNFNPVHVFLHFNSFCLEVLKLILASKLSELEQFENRAANGLFTYKIEFSGKWLRSRAKCKEGDPL